jgi:chitinase
MKHRKPIVTLLLAAFCAFNAASRVLAAPTGHALWVTAYYPVWEQQSNLPPDQIDYSAFSDLIQFAVMPTASGGIDQSSPTAVTPAISQAVITPAHAAGDKVLICIGGSGSGPAFSQAIADGVRDTLINNLMSLVTTRGYDGIDVDMEPINPSDVPNFATFVQALHAKMKAANPKLLLTAAASPEPGGQPAMFASLHTDFDQINIMTYDLSGTWDGFKTWYNSSLYGDGSVLMTDTVAYPSVSEVLQRYITAGTPKSELGIGIAFYGDVWTPATGPTQAISGVTITQLGYNTILDTCYSPSAYHWDDTAKAPYLTIPATAQSPAKFITYDDTRLAAAKVRFARSEGIGGVTLFEIGDGYRPAQPAGQRDALLQAVKRAWRSGE